MFGFFKKTNSEIDEIYWLLNMALADEGVGKKSAEHLFQRDDLEELFNLGKNTATAAELALLWRQSIFAERMLEQASFNDIAKEYIEIADQKNKTADELIETECDGYIESAKAYGERLAVLLDSGTLTDDHKVRDFCASHATSMLACWIRYRLKLREALMEVLNQGTVDYEGENDEMYSDLSEEEDRLHRR